jgi:hypothetical protein
MATVAMFGLTYRRDIALEPEVRVKETCLLTRYKEWTGGGGDILFAQFYFCNILVVIDF